MPKISDLTAAASAALANEFAINEAGSSKKVTSQQIYNLVLATIESIGACATLDSGDSLMMLENDSDLKPVTYEVVEDAIAETMYAETDIGAIADADVFLVKDGGTTKGTTTAATLATYMLAELEPSILDISDLAALAAPADADIILTCTGTTPKKTTWLQMKNEVLAGLDTYLTALAAAGAGGDTDVIYVTQGGVEKKMTLLQLKTYVGVSITGTGVLNQFARWTSATNLKADIGMIDSGTGFAGAGSDVAVPTTAAVRGEMDTIIGDLSEIGGALADADHIIVEDDTDSTQKKSLLSRVYTWLLSQVTDGTVSASEIVVPDANKDIAGYRNHGATNYDAGASGTAGTVDVFPTTASKGKITYGADDSTDDVTIQVTNEAQTSDVYSTKELRYPDVGHSDPTQFKMLSLPDRYRLEWVAGRRGIPQLNGSVANDIADKEFEIDGTGATDAQASHYAEGGVSLSTVGTATGDYTVMLPHQDADQSAWEQVTWGTDQETRWECRIRTAASITDTIIFAGLKISGTSSKTIDNDQIFFRYEDGVNSGKFEICQSIGGVDTATDTGVTVAINTDYHLVISIQSDRKVRAWINADDTFPPQTAMTDATDLTPFIGIEDGSVAGTVLTVHVRGQAIERDFA